MGNKWREIWEKRNFENDILKQGDYKKIFMALKCMSGFDAVGEIYGAEMGFEQFYGQYVMIKNELAFSQMGKTYPLESVFEVGCGSGANLYLFQREGMSVGGIDYSKAQIGIAGMILENPKELVYDEAINLSCEVKYDAVLSNSVFSYFEDYEYALKVLEIMYEKTNHSMGIIDIHDIDKKDDFITYRKKISEDYEERYRELPKLFYDRTFFLDFAKKYGLDIKFCYSDIGGYWNNDFVFNCFLWQNNRKR